MKGAAISTNLFALLGVQPFRGRTFHPDEVQTTNSQVVILSHGFWQRRFGADAKLVGQTVRFSDETYTVVGVTAPDFKFPTEPTLQLEPDFFIPLRFSEERDSRNSLSVHVLARLKPETGVEQAQAEANTIAMRLAKEYREQHGSRDACDSLARFTPRTGSSGAAHPLRRRQLRAVNRLRECRQPAAGSRGSAKAGACRSLRAGSKPLQAAASVSRREPSVIRSGSCRRAADDGMGVDAGDFNSAARFSENRGDSH
jgi:hypothetical protein